eukprot:PhM_4_TR17229/c0_g1_i1/m.106165
MSDVFPLNIMSSALMPAGGGHRSGPAAASSRQSARPISDNSGGEGSSSYSSAAAYASPHKHPRAAAPSHTNAKTQGEVPLNDFWCRMFKSQEQCGGPQSKPTTMNDFKPLRKVNSLGTMLGFQKSSS